MLPKAIVTDETFREHVEVLPYKNVAKPHLNADAPEPANRAASSCPMKSGRAPLAPTSHADFVIESNVVDMPVREGTVRPRSRSYRVEPSSLLSCPSIG